MKAVPRPLTLERLKSLLSYDPKTGIFRWKVAQSRRNHVGDEAGSIHKNTGYRFIQIDGIAYTAGRLAWFYHYGRWPEGEADHEDLNKLNNRIRNLRDATGAQNKHNVGILRNNTSGFKGVSRFKDSIDRPWRAQIRLNGERHYLGRFATAEEAAAAYSRAANSLHGKFARLR